MKVLVDECAPKAFRTFLSQRGHDCKTVQETGWSGKQNGELLELAESDFDVFVTVDTNVPYQQNLSSRKIVVVILIAATNRLVVSGRFLLRVLLRSRGSGSENS